MRVIDCADPALVLRLVNDRTTRALCIAAGENRLLVPAGSEQAFRRAVRKLGYAVPVPTSGARRRPLPPRVLV